MDQTLKQVGELLLGAIPTVVILLFLYAAYTTLVGRPLRRVLDERRKRTEGAILKARADVAAAEAHTQEYEERLREAKSAIFKAMESRRNAAQHARDEAISQAREIAHQQIREAKTALDQEMAAARAGLQSESERLAEQIIQTVLRPAGIVPTPSGTASVAGGHS
jgi:F-type H+-transporting ATPase subunit b